MEDNNMISMKYEQNQKCQFPNSQNLQTKTPSYHSKENLKNQNIFDPEQFLKPSEIHSNIIFQQDLRKEDTSEVLNEFYKINPFLNPKNNYEEYIDQSINQNIEANMLRANQKRKLISERAQPQQSTVQSSYQQNENNKQINAMINGLNQSQFAEIYKTNNKIKQSLKITENKYQQQNNNFSQNDNQTKNSKMKTINDLISRQHYQNFNAKSINIDNLEKSVNKRIDDGKKIYNLPNGFCHLLEMLNLYFLFSDVFKLEEGALSKIIKSLQQNLQLFQKTNDYRVFEQNLNNDLKEEFKYLLKTIVYYIVHDLNSEKLQLLNISRTYNTLCLVKFCQENQLFEFVFKYNWPIIVCEIVRMFESEMKDENNINQQFTKSLQFIENCILNQNHLIPENFSIKFQLISLLIDCYSKTNTFRQLFNKKSQINKANSVRKTELEEQKKTVQQSLKKIYNIKNKKTKKIAKVDNKKKKNSIDQNLLSDQQVQKVQYKDMEVKRMQQELQNMVNEIERQNLLDSLSCCFYLGKNRNGILFWFVLYFPNLIFLEEQDQRWSFMSIEQIEGLLNNLDHFQYNEKKLQIQIKKFYTYEIKRYIKSLQIVSSPLSNESKKTVLPYQPSTFKNSSEIIENQINQQIQNENQNSPFISKSGGQQANDELLESLGAFKIDKESFFKMIQIGQKKMSEYLKDRNSKWGNEGQRQILFNTILSNDQDWLECSKKQISLFNQKICVVEIQYKVYVEQSIQQIDSKIKKIQTKIWGINQKYKHNWYDFINACTLFCQLFFAVSVLYSLIKKYTSKFRKLRKQYEQIKQKTVFHTTSAIKQWKKSWNDVCQVCGLVGEVLCCDFCPKVYHLDCINLPLIPTEQFKCKSCKEQITTRHQLKSFNEAKKYK